MKRLIIINIILLTLIYFLPSNNVQDTKENIQENNIVEETKVGITSRSLEEPRQAEIVEEIYVAPTTYSEELVEMVKRYERI